MVKDKWEGKVVTKGMTATSFPFFSFFFSSAATGEWKIDCGKRHQDLL